MPTNINGNTGIDKVQDGTVVNADIATLDASKLTGSIAAARIANNTIDSAHIASGAVDDAHVSGIAATKLTGALPAISAANLTAIPAANITGTLPAISAANLTSIPAANITGTLPAISGANLTGLTSTQMPSGSIVQFASDFDGAYINLNTTSWVNTALSISFTPKFSNSIIIAQAIVNMYTVGAGSTHGNTRYQILKDGSDYGEEFNIYSGYGGTEALVVGPMPAYYSATSGSTSAQTYTVRVRNPQTASGGSHNQ